MSNPLPLTRPQLVALLAAVAREFGHGLRAVSAEVAGWRRYAASIPDPALRADALHALDSRRGHIDGAALFWTLPSRRNRGLLQLLVAYELIQDYLDGVSERATAARLEKAEQPFRALADALDPDRTPAAYYAGLPWAEDNGFLAALVQACRDGARALPSFEVIRPLLDREVQLAEVLHLNHERDPDVRDAALRGWASTTFEHDHGLQWYELTAAASGWITTHALFALAAEPGVTAADVSRTHSAYFPHAALTLTMLDSWADRDDDARSGDHSYVAHYPTPERAVLRLCASIDRTARDMLALRNGERHAVLLACMIALYMSKDGTLRGDARDLSRRIVRSGGTLPRVLLPVLRIWRRCNAQSATT